MNFKDLLLSRDIDPKTVLVMRHRPPVAQLNKVLPWLASVKPDVFNAYQQTQGEKVERAMLRAKFVASFIRHESTRAVFVGLYEIKPNPRPIEEKEFWEIPAVQELKGFGMTAFNEIPPRSPVLWFDLGLTDFYSHWKGVTVHPNCSLGTAVPAR